MLQVYVTLLILFLGPPQNAPKYDASVGDCVRYEPDTVAIRGRLHRYIFYGQPGFGEEPRHDVQEPGFYLDLATPICTRYGKNAEVDVPEKTVHRVQLVLDSVGYARLRPFLGKQVTIRGTIFAGFTGHHHAPLLLNVVAPYGVLPPT